MNITVFLGAPGSGKGTQAKKLAEKNGYRHFSTGDILRSAIQAGTELGKQAKYYLDRGELVPDATMIGLIQSELAKVPPSAKVLLDGFPRTMTQAEALDRNGATAVRQAIFFSVPSEALVRRLTGRRTCEKCGASYHIVHLPPKKTDVCDKCGGKVIQRTDDSESVVRRRLQVFEQQTQQLLSYYQSRKKLEQLDADRAIDVIQADLVRLLS